MFELLTPKIGKGVSRDTAVCSVLTLHTSAHRQIDDQIGAVGLPLRQRMDTLDTTLPAVWTR